MTRRQLTMSLRHIARKASVLQPRLAPRSPTSASSHGAQSLRAATAPCLMVLCVATARAAVRDVILPLNCLFMYVSRLVRQPDILTPALVWCHMVRSLCGCCADPAAQRDGANSPVRLLCLLAQRTSSRMPT